MLGHFKLGVYRNNFKLIFSEPSTSYNPVSTSHGLVATEATVSWLVEARGQLTEDTSLGDRLNKGKEV